MANKRVIDLPTLSEEVQEGQYILVDAAGGTGKMDLKGIVDEAGSFDPAGEYPELYAGNLTTDEAQTDITPYLFRHTGGNLSRIGERCYETIIGASVGENQLVQSGATSVTVPNGHKYYSKINGAESLGASTGSAITINDSAEDMVIDLSLYLPANIVNYIYSLETATAGAGIAKLRSWGFLRGYQAHNAGSIESVEVTGKKVVGFNQFYKDTMTVDGEYIVDSTGEAATGSSYKRTDYIPVIGGKTYFIKTEQTNGAWGAWYDADKNYVSECVYYTAIPLQTAPANARYIRLTIATSNGGSADTFCFSLSSSRNGEYEAYTEQSYDYGTDTLRGIFKLDASNNLYADGDTKTSDGTITRKYGIRAYQSGDESLADAFTNGIQTVYKLTTPTTEQSTPFPSPQVCYPDGTEEYITGTGVPVGHETEYPYDLKGLVEGLIDVPDVPSTNGTYVLKATRSASGVVYNWVTG